MSEYVYACIIMKSVIRSGLHDHAYLVTTLSVLPDLERFGGAVSFKFIQRDLVM